MSWGKLSGRFGFTRAGRVFALVFGLLVTACASTFEAVDAAGKLGQKIDGSTALGAPAQLCRETNALALAPAPSAGGSAAKAPDCAALEKAGSGWNAVADALAAYAAKLSALASREDVTV